MSYQLFNVVDNVTITKTIYETIQFAAASIRKWTRHIPIFPPLLGICLRWSSSVNWRFRSSISLWALPRPTAFIMYLVPGGAIAMTATWPWSWIQVARCSRAEEWNGSCKRLQLKRCYEDILIRRIPLCVFVCGVEHLFWYCVYSFYARKEVLTLNTSVNHMIGLRLE